MDLTLTPQDVLENINSVKPEIKKKRGRPLKNLNTPIVNEKQQTVIKKKEDIELILQLKGLNKDDIKDIVEKDEKIEDETSETIEENDNEESSDTDDNDKDKIMDLQKKILLLQKSNKSLKEVIEQIQPTYQTEIKTYPLGVDVIDNNKNLIIPRKTNVCCEYDGEPIDGIPVYFVVNIIENELTKKTVFVKRGCGESFSFCSFNCYYTYLMNCFNTEDIYRYLSFLKIYYMKLYNITNIDEITLSTCLHKQYLKKYGGNMSIEEFRDKNRRITIDYYNSIPPFVSSNYEVNEFIKTESFSSRMISTYPCGAKQHKKIQNNNQS